MNNLPAELQYRLAQLETCIQNQQNQSALLALEDLTRVPQRDYQQIQKAYLTLQQLHDSTQTKKSRFTFFLSSRKMSKIKLLPPQKPTVKDWCNEHNGRLIQIRDRSCRYREAIIEWSTEILYPHLKQRAIISYQTSLELTPTGKIRREIHQQENVRYVQTEDFEDETQLVLPLGEVIEQIPPPPKDIVRNYLFPRDKSEPKPATKRKVKPKQQTLPLDGVAATLNEIGLSKGRNPESTESLLAGKVDHYSLDQGKVIPLPQAYVDLLIEAQASNQEWESIIELYQVCSPGYVLNLIQDIDTLRDLPQVKTFTHPKPKVISQSTVSTTQPQRTSFRSG